MFNRPRTSLLSPLSVILAFFAYAYPATAAIIPAARVTTWNPGIPGGIPVVTTIHTTINAATYGNGTTDAAGAINSAIQAAGNTAASTGIRQVVFLPAGTYRLTSAPIDLNRSNVVLRGAGAKLTKIFFDSGATTSVVRMGIFWPSYSASDVINVVGSVAKGATSITVADASKIQVGDVLQIDQEDDASYVVVGDGTYFKRGPGSTPPAAKWRSVGQQIEVASKSGNVLGLSGPIHIAFNAAFLPQVFKTATARSGEWGTKYTGLEDLYVNGGNNGNINLLDVAYSWIRNVESDGSPSGVGGKGMDGGSIAFDAAYRCELRGSYVHHARSINPGGGAYGIVVRSQSSDNLIEDNIAYMLDKPIVLVASGGGNVVAYNYSDQAIIDYQLSWQENTIDGGHNAFPHFELIEGNWSPTIGGDTTHGNTGWLTFFRNYARGRNGDNVSFQNVQAANATGFSRFYNFVGNVLLYPGVPPLQGFAAIYENTWNGSTQVGNLFAAAAFRVGNSAYPTGPEWDNGEALAGLYRHGNFDYVTNSVIWDSTNTDHVLPNSLYLTSKPAFFGNNPWPWVDPQGATKVATLPAKARFDAGTPIAPNPNTFVLTVAKAGTGAGTVTSAPAGISCGTSCNAAYSSGTSVTLTQAATAGSTFAGWSGACSGTGACTVGMSAAQSVTATFTLNTTTFTLSVAKAGTGAGTVTSSPAGISCGADCSDPYNSGTVVTLTQSATAGSSFTGWSGACTGTGACSVTVDAAKSVTATFALAPFTLTVAKAGTGAGTVTSSPAGISCGADCSEPYNSGTVVTLTQAATAGSSFTGWSGACTGTGACSVTVDAAKSVTATFTLNTFTLTVAKAGTGAGTVTSSPAGISCGADCSEPYNSGTVVTLTQSATAGSSFTGWSGACTGTGACSVTMSAAKSVTATFTLNTFTLTVAKAGNGAGTVTSSPAGISCGADCSEPYNSGTVVTLTQAPTAGSSFTGWSGACTGTGACSVTVDAAKSVTATFTLNTFTLTVAKAGTGAGTVTSSPAGISCGADCSEPYNSGTVVTLTQAATAGSSFSGWSGACTGTGACSVTVDAAKSVTATFTLNALTLSVVKAGTGAGTVTSSPAGISCGADCSEPYTSGTVVTLTQAASAGSTFTGWSGACTGTGACSVTVDAAKSVTATFTLNTFTLTVAKAGTGAGTVTSSPAGISCGADCSEVYGFGTVVTLTQAATAGSTFSGWSGACTGTGACSVTVDAAKSVTATFTLNPFTLTVAKAGTGTGTVTSSPAGISCGADCSEPYNSGTVVTLTQAASAGSSFTGWSGACTGTGACSVTMDAAKSVTATFTLDPLTLSVVKAGTGAGTVTSSPAGISCGADCSEPYASGTVVTLTQAATAGSTFTGWSGACTGTGACSVTVNAAKSVTATFTLGTSNLAVSKSGTGAGTVTSSPVGINCGTDCSEAFATGTVVTLTQTATAGSTFTGWSGACTGTGACQVTMSAAKSVAAIFTLNTFSLTTLKAGSGAGTVTSSPVGISCGADCAQAYNPGTVVTLTQTVTAGSTFNGWSGACTGTGACSVTMDAAKSVTATYTLNSATLTVLNQGGGTGTITSSPAGISCGTDCTESYDVGTVVTLTQAAGTGSTFTGWSGACTGTGACQVTLTAAKSVAAVFTLSSFSLTTAKAGTGVGTITSSPAGINCGTDCTQLYSFGAVITLTQTAATGSTFSGWTGACSGAGACSVTMDAAKSVTAAFDGPGATSVDLQISVQKSADPANVGLPLTYTVNAKNAHATRKATKVVASDTLPASFSFGSAGAGCTFTAPKVTCALGDLPPGQQASRTITVIPTTPGTFMNAASTSASEPEDTPDNNSTSLPTTVLAAPKISVNDVSVTEGNAGSVPAVFAVTLSAAFPTSVTVGYTVTPLTAGPGDFTASTGSLVFPAGTTSLPLSVPVQGDVLPEINETFLVTLVSSDHGTFAKPQGVGTIIDDDQRPTVSIADATVTVNESDIGYRVALLRVNLSAPVGMPVKVAYATKNGTALAGKDYLPASGTLVFPEGTTAGELALWVVGDFVSEAAKTFTVNLAQPENATIANGTATVTIDDNDATPGLAIADVRIAEGNAGSRNALFRVTLSAVAPTDVSVDWTTQDLTATVADGDYLPSGGTLTIKKGSKLGSLSVPVKGDTMVERNEAFLVRLSNATGARIVDDQAQGVILNDDGTRDAVIPIASLPYVATLPGRYRLANDLVFAPTTGAAVTIAANGVVLDLDGHTLSGTGGAATQAIGVLSRNRSIITVQNGTIQGFMAGVFLAGAPPYKLASRFSVLNLHVHSSTYAGIWLEGRGNQVVSCEVLGTGGTTALEAGAGAVGISSIGAMPKLTQNQVLDTVASAGGDAFGIAASGATSGLVSGNLVRNSSSGPASGILVTKALKASVTLNTLQTLDYGVVFTSGASGTCKGNTMTGVATPNLGVTCTP